MLVVALRLEMQHVWLQRKGLPGVSVPNGRELRPSSWLIPRFVPDDKRVEFGDTEVGERIDDVVVPPPGASVSG